MGIRKRPVERAREVLRRPTEPVDEYNALDRTLEHKRRLVTKNDIVRALQRADLVIDPQNPAHGLPVREHQGGFDGFSNEPLLFNHSPQRTRRWDPDARGVWHLYERQLRRSSYREWMTHLAFSGALDGEELGGFEVVRLDLSDVEDLLERHIIVGNVRQMTGLLRAMKFSRLGGQLLRGAHARLAEPKRVSVARAIRTDPTRSDRDIARDLEVSPTLVGAVRREMDT